MDLRQKVKISGFPYWRIADKIGIAESTMIRWLRIPEKLSKDNVAKIEAAILELKEERK